MARLNHVKSFRGTTKTEDGNLTCGHCHDKIKPGDGYRWWANRRPGQRGSFRNIRCMKPECTPTTADRTPGRRGQLMQIQETLGKTLYDADNIEDLDAVREDAASQLRDLGQEFTDGADNMEEGFGHATYQSDELREKGEVLEALADELENLSADDYGSDEVEEFDEAEVGKEVAQELFGIDDPNDLEDEQRPEFEETMDTKREEHETEHEEKLQEVLEEYRTAIEEKLGEAEV